MNNCQQTINSVIFHGLSPLKSSTEWCLGGAYGVVFYMWSIMWWHFLIGRHLHWSHGPPSPSCCFSRGFGEYLVFSLMWMCGYREVKMKIREKTFELQVKLKLLPSGKNRRELFLITSQSSFYSRLAVVLIVFCFFLLPGLGIQIFFSDIGRKNRLQWHCGLYYFSEKTLLSSVFLSA